VNCDRDTYDRRKGRAKSGQPLRQRRHHMRNSCPLVRDSKMIEGLGCASLGVQFSASRSMHLYSGTRGIPQGPICFLHKKRTELSMQLTAVLIATRDFLVSTEHLSCELHPRHTILQTGRFAICISHTHRFVQKIQPPIGLANERPQLLTQFF
jgi:hypothetical protein